MNLQYVRPPRLWSRRQAPPVQRAQRASAKALYLLTLLIPVALYQYLGTRLWRLRAARAARGAPAGGSAGVVGAHKFTEGAYFLFPFRRVSRLRRPFFLRPIASPCRTG